MQQHGQHECIRRVTMNAAEHATHVPLPVYVNAWNRQIRVSDASAEEGIQIDAAAATIQNRKKLIAPDGRKV